VTPTDGPPPADNPFSTRNIRPGAIPFRFPPGETPERLVQRLGSHDWRGEIVGPHGSGKSSLLAVLIPALEQAGRDVILIELHDGQRNLPVDLGSLDALRDNALVIVDGYEQLSLWSRRGLKRFCGLHGVGLLVTSHRPAGFPPLFQTGSSVALAEEVVGLLLPDWKQLLSRDELARRFDLHHGDLRELLFGLYDLYEQHRTGDENGL